jgi:hypothetical protein
MVLVMMFLRGRAAARPFLKPMTRAMGCFVATLIFLSLREGAADEATHCSQWQGW